MKNILEIKNVTKSYKDFKIDDISFNLEKGYIMGFVGANGTGKTTTIKLIMNLIKKQSGQINIFGMDNVLCEKEVKERIGFVYDENIYFEHLKIGSLAKLISKFYKKWDWSAFDNYMKRFDLDKNKKISKLSKGTKTKVSIAIALSHNAELIIMDEPTSGLDPVFRSEILEILHDVMLDENKSILFSTHITSDLEKIADHITFIDKGKILFSEAYSKIIDDYRVLKGPKSLLDRVDKTLLIGCNAGKFGIEALTREGNRISQIYGDEIVLEKPTIEDIMVYHIKKKIEINV